jgi:hypothetical protein
MPKPTMHTIRPLLKIVCAIAMMSAFGCSNPDTKSLQPLLDKISHSPDSELSNLLYGYSKSSAGAQQVLLGMLRPLRAPTPDQHMTIEGVRQSGRFTMIVARVPWPRGTEPAGLQPILITGENGHEQVVGSVLPFDDILSLMQGEDMQNITELSQWWIENFGQRRGR